MERTWTAMRLAAVVIGCLFSVATSAPEGGERTAGDDDDDIGADGGSGSCPAGETCSPETPYGLYFGVPALGDDPLFEIVPPLPTAVGGRQTITVYRDAEATAPFWFDYDAVTTDPTVIDVVDAAPPTVTVRADRTGMERLRLVEAGTDLLLDRISLRSATVDSARLTLAREEQSYLWDDQLAPIAVGAHVNLVVALEDAYGDRLVDTNARVVRPDGWPDDPTRWDVFQAAPAAAAVYVLSIEAGERTFTAQVEAVDAIDEIVYDGGRTEVRVAPEPLDLFCFRAVAGEQRVLVDWQFTARGDLSISLDEMRGCIRARGLQPGSGTLTASAMGRELTLELDVVTTAAPAEAKAPADTPLALTPGERAAL